MVEKKVSAGLILVTMAVIGPAQVAARALWFAVGRGVRPAVVGMVVTKAFPVSVVVLLCAGTSPYLLILFALVYGGANGMMTILRGTIVQDVTWTKGYRCKRPVVHAIEYCQRHRTDIGCSNLGHPT